MCVDYRQLNQKTRKDAFPLPRIEKSLDALSGACWFSTMDLASRYNQVPVTENDKLNTAFCTLFGLFEWNRMPFGLCNAPSTFQRLMEHMFGAQYCNSLLLYLDDVVVFSSKVDEPVEHLDVVLGWLKQEGQKVKLAKCAFFNPFAQMPNQANSHPCFCALLWGFITHEMSITETWNEAGHLYHLQYQLYLYINYNKRN